MKNVDGLMHDLRAGEEMASPLGLDGHSTFWPSTTPAGEHGE
jgi:hypothetical protein